MHKFYTLLVREVRSYFHSPIAYVVLIFFLLVAGVDFYFQVSFMNQRQVQYTVQEAFFNSVFFWFAFVLIFPLITMRLFAEEFKLGTIEHMVTFSRGVIDTRPIVFYVSMTIVLLILTHQAFQSRKWRL